MTKLPATALLTVAGLIAPTTSSADSATAPVTLRYTILSSGRIAGSEIDTYSAGGHVESHFEFNDRGRGPKLTAHYLLARNSVPQQTDVTGSDYLSSPVDEHFAVSGNTSRWNSTTEHGEAPAGSFYVSSSGSPLETAFLAAALRAAKKGTLALLPGGEARLARFAATTVESLGAEKLHVTGYAVSGLGFAPQQIWLDDQQRLFAAPGSTFAVVRAGWEGANERLHQLDLGAETARLEQLARALAQRPVRPIAIEHVRVFDAEQAVGRDDQTVVIDGPRIASVGPSGTAAVPAAAERIDGRGKTLLPGLFDMHVHADAADGLLHIASGVTSVRDMGNDIDELARLSREWRDGTAVGPRVWMAGMIDGKDPLQAPSGIFVSSAEEARAAVERYADLGYVQVKLYSSLAPELVPGIIVAAHARGLRVSGHVPNGMLAAQFVAAGADELQHINFVFLNFLGSKVRDTRTPERFTAVGMHAATLDLDSPEVAEFIALLKAHQTTLDVTLVTFEQMFTGRRGRPSSDFAPVLTRLPAQVRRLAYAGSLPVDATTDARYRESYRALLGMTKRLYDSGLQILAGTDWIPGIMLHRELELEVEAGIPAPCALQIATYGAARLLHQEAELGSIAAGKRADLLLVDGNPLERMSDVRRGRLVFRDGIRYQSAAVYAAAGMGPAP